MIEIINLYLLPYINSVSDYMNEVFTHAESNGIPTRCSYQKLKLSHRKTNKGNKER